MLYCVFVCISFLFFSVLYIVVFCLSYYHVLSVNKERAKELHIAAQLFDLQLHSHFSLYIHHLNPHFTNAVDLDLMLIVNLYNKIHNNNNIK